MSEPLDLDDLKAKALAAHAEGRSCDFIRERRAFDRALTPPTVLALIERLERAEAERDSTVKEMHARELHHFEEEKLRAEAEARIAAALVGHREKRGETPRHADGDHQAEIEPTRWEYYVICDYCKTTWPCKTFTALTVESENTE